MRIVVVDGQGGGMGKTIAERMREEFPEEELLVAGINAIATANMLKSGARQGATGENAVCWNCARADVIIGPVGIILPNAMLGEVSPAIAQAVVESAAKKVLIPVSKNRVHLVGVAQRPLAQYLDEAAQAIREFAGGKL